ncbi:MAG TPA: hypothetical protein DCZ59_03570 [Bacteroidetes bacterium]|nr:hypothetical protein [Bacteroidota bacterium]
MNVIIIGAGMSGLIAGHILQERGINVMLLDKGRGVGGRMATRRMEDAVFDHGAQFLTARSDWFINVVDTWISQGAVAPWFATHDGGPHIRYRGVPSMNALAKHLARGLDVRLSTTVVSIGCFDSGWNISIEDGTVLTADACLITAPIPQALALAKNLDLDVHPDELESLQRLEYDPCMAVMCTLASASGLPPDGPFRPAGSSCIALVADNAAKGVSPVPCLTIHSTPEFARMHIEEPEEAHRIMVDEAARYIKSEIVHSVIHRWRFAQPSTQHPAPFSTLHSRPPLVLAGDAFGGARIEGAALSGLAAADHLSTL